MKRSGIFIAIVAGLLTTVPVAVAHDDDDRGRDDKFETRLSGYNEVHFSGGSLAASGTFSPATLRGAVSTKARGKFQAKIDKDKEVIHYKLSYEGLEGAVTQAHIHFGQRHTVGGIVVWLCQTSGTPAPASVASLTPFCPEPDGTVTGTITPEQVLAQTAQGIETGEFDELVRAIHSGAAYANVHSSLFPPGEIRGQIEEDDDRDRKDRR
jgi:hypothetical protein